MQLVLHDDVAAKMDKGAIKIDPRSETKRARSQWGTSRTLVNNLMPASPRASRRSSRSPASAIAPRCRARTCSSQLGYSHDVVYPIPEGITIATPKPTEITITGIDKQKVGQVAAEIRDFRPPEPYKGKGVKYAGEYIFRKEGKKK